MVTANPKLENGLIATMERIRRTLAQAFSGMEAQFQPARNAEGIVLTVLWDGFAFRDGHARQDLVWQVLEFHHSPEDINAIHLIWTLTPDEDRSIREDF